MDITNAVGIAATTIGLISWLPQLWKSYTIKQTSNISWGYLTIMLLAIFLWVLYGYLCGNWLLMVGNALSLCMGVILIGMKYKYERQ